MIDRRQFIVGIAAVSVAAAACAKPARGALVKVYKSPSCGCCLAWVEHLRDAGYVVQVTNLDDVTPIARKLGIPDDLRSCHTSTVGRYFVEGHVPAADIAKLLREKPKARGIAVPGMPLGSPGMEQGGRAQPFETLLVTSDGRRRRFAAHAA